MPEEQAKEALSLYASMLPRMIVGYTPELQKLYKKDFEGFLKLKYEADRGQES